MLFKMTRQQQQVGPYCCCRGGARAPGALGAGAGRGAFGGRAARGAWGGGGLRGALGALGELGGLGGGAGLGVGGVRMAGWMGVMPRDTGFLLVSFGGPEGPDDVMPFLRNVTSRRGVPDERLAAVAEHYFQFGGVSPINGQCRDLLEAIEKDFAVGGIDLPLYWGNRNWQPFLTDTLQAMAADGITRAIAFATSAYSSYSSCRQYLDDIDRARAVAGENAPEVVKIPPYYRHPAFVASFADSAARALESLPPAAGAGVQLIFTAHSIPDSMAATSGPAGSGERTRRSWPRWPGWSPLSLAGPTGGWLTRAAAARHRCRGSDPT